MTASAATSVSNLSDVQQKILSKVFLAAYEADLLCDGHDNALRDSVGLEQRDGPVVEITLTAKNVLAVETHLLLLHAGLAELYARLAPVAIGWITALPDVTARAIVDETNTNGLFDRSILARLFARAGIGERFAPGDEPE